MVNIYLYEETILKFEPASFIAFGFLNVMAKEKQTHVQHYHVWSVLYITCIHLGEAVHHILAQLDLPLQLGPGQLLASCLPAAVAGHQPLLQLDRGVVAVVHNLIIIIIIITVSKIILNSHLTQLIDPSLQCVHQGLGVILSFLLCLEYGTI